MYAAVSTFAVKPGKVDELAEVLQSSMAESIPGLQSVHLVADRETGEVLAFALYETEVQARALADEPEQLEDVQQNLARADSIMVKRPDRRVYEVVAQVGGREDRED